MKKQGQQCEKIKSSPIPLNALDQGKIGVTEPDLEKYREHIEDFDMTDEQKRELLETLWSIMATFVDIGFGVDTVQLLFNDHFPDSSNFDVNGVNINRSVENFNRVSLIKSGKEIDT